jgi:hypothetical protein
MIVLGFVRFLVIRSFIGIGAFEHGYDFAIKEIGLVSV